MGQDRRLDEEWPHYRYGHRSEENEYMTVETTSWRLSLTLTSSGWLSLLSFFFFFFPPPPPSSRCLLLSSLRVLTRFSLPLPAPLPLSIYLSYYGYSRAEKSLRSDRSLVTREQKEWREFCHSLETNESRFNLFSIPNKNRDIHVIGRWKQENKCARMGKARLVITETWQMQ